MWSSCVRSRITRAVQVAGRPTWQPFQRPIVVPPAATLLSQPFASLPHPLTVTVRSMSFNVMGDSSDISNPLELFRDPVDRETRGRDKVGRSWSATELRRKSYQDLHKLWYVLYMEKNMLITERQLSRRRNLIFPQPERMKKVQKSMGAIKQVLGERKRRTIAAYKANKLEEKAALLALADEEALLDGMKDDMQVNPEK